MKKLLLSLIIILLFSCEKECYEFTTQRTDNIYFNDSIIMVIEKPPEVEIVCDLSPMKARDYCRMNTYTTKPKKYVVMLEVDGVIYPYYFIEFVYKCNY